MRADPNAAQRIGCRVAGSGAPWVRGVPPVRAAGACEAASASVRVDFQLLVVVPDSASAKASSSRALASSSLRGAQSPAL